MIKGAYEANRDKPSDINEHMETLMRKARECVHITEMGVRSMVSTWAFLEGLRERGGKLVSVDIVGPEKYGADTRKIRESCLRQGVDFEFILGDSLVIDIEETDLLFLDTLHFYKQVSGELARHADKARRYIILHDTEGSPGELWPAIAEFLGSHAEWAMWEHYTYNNGLTILKRL